MVGKNYSYFKNKVRELSKTGFSLIELSVVIVIISVAVATLVTTSKNTSLQAENKSTLNNFTKIKSALQRHLDKYKYYPCPADLIAKPNATNFGEGTGTDTASGGCNATNIYTPAVSPTIYVGAVPVKNLGLKNEDMVDAYGNRIMYIISDAQTKKATGCNTKPDLTVLKKYTSSSSPGDAYVHTKNANYVLISYGKNGVGSIPYAGLDTLTRKSPVNTNNAAQIINNHQADDQFTNIFMKPELTQPDFDDIVDMSYADAVLGSVDEFQVNNAITYGIQLEPEVISLQDGGFLIGWNSTITNRGSFNLSVRAYNADGTPKWSENPINQFGYSRVKRYDTEHVSLTQLEDGTILMSGGVTNMQGSKFRYFVSNLYSFPTISDISSYNFMNSSQRAAQYMRINVPAKLSLGSKFNPQIQALKTSSSAASGGYTVLFSISYKDGTVYGCTKKKRGVCKSYGQVAVYRNRIFSYMYDTNHNLITSKLINTTTLTDFLMTYWPIDPSIIPYVYTDIDATNDGGFIVTWPDASNVYYRKINADGSAQNITQTQANTGLANADTALAKPKVATLDNGDFVITWNGAGTGDSDGVWAQRYSNNAPIGSNFLVNTTTTNNQSNQNITALNNGGFIITWKSIQTETPAGQWANDPPGPTSYGIFAQKFNSDGTKNGTEFQVNQFTKSSQAEPSVVVLNDGRIVTTWTSDFGRDGSQKGIFAIIQSDSQFNICN